LQTKSGGGKAERGGHYGVAWQRGKGFNNRMKQIGGRMSNWGEHEDRSTAGLLQKRGGLAQMGRYGRRTHHRMAGPGGGRFKDDR